MPRAKEPVEGALLDAWGRAGNRKHADRSCAVCQKVFRPKRSTSRYCSRPCMWSQNGGHNKALATWWLSQKGYVIGRVWEGEVKRHVKKHRLFMEEALGRALLPDEDVHHINGDKTDNRIENLQVLPHGVHSSLSNAQRKRKAALAAAGIEVAS